QIGEDIDGPFRRRFLQKACYLNPDVFRQYRSFFASAGFRVVDCPSLTQQGKSAADIHLVLDVVDALDHRTRFDEFIICSADADFTPLMARVRTHDRRTVMVAASPSAPAYQAVCDQVVTPIQIAEAFSPDVPAVSTDLPAEPVADPVGHAAAPLEGVEPAGHQLTDEEIDAAVTAVREAVDAAGGALPGARAAGAAIAVVPRIAQVRWAEADGFSGFIARRLPELRLIRSASGGFVIDPARRSAGDRMGAEVRERAAARGFAVPRSAANFVIQGLIYAGSDPREPHDADYFARRWYDNVLLLAERAGMELPDDGEEQIRAWILGAPSPPHPTEPDPVA
ncbi:MAG: NYN domain-containing protein, partial [Candidatus Nanopelagicales bacterium]|nr:NYN domain-containing protein [Candidatus Nanopelagicales bacterium]